MSSRNYIPGTYIGLREDGSSLTFVAHTQADVDTLINQLDTTEKNAAPGHRLIYLKWIKP